ncbi:hypothetical protein F5Y10DRAFT_233534 [Nemania abortiva]|nr:hypothetical protein F5Y10DRAFT_233534 [Nemania abortiva]
MKRRPFALGPCMYEIMAWIRLFQDLEHGGVSKRYKSGEFPSLDSIQNSWHEIYNFADEVAE